MQRLAEGWVGQVQHPKAAGLYVSARKAASKVLQICTEDGGLVPLYRSNRSWTVPAYPKLPDCGGKKLHIIAVTSMHVKPGASTSADMWGSFLMRGLALPAFALTKGHNASWYSQLEHGDLFRDCLTDPNYKLPFDTDVPGVYNVALVVKTKPHDITQCLHKFNIPVVLDLIDSSLNFEDKKDYKLIMATSRLNALMMEANTGVRSIPVYHQPCNYARFHRADRRRPVKVIGVTRANNNHGLMEEDLANMLRNFTKANNMTFRLGSYSGHGFDQDEMRGYLLYKHDWGAQNGYAMGYSDVDIGFVWLACHAPELVCIKPTPRLAMYLSMGIPTIFIGTSAYLDMVVEYGYPFVASDNDEAMTLLKMLVEDADLRQAGSELGLVVAERLHLDTIGEEFERALCYAVGDESSKAERTDEGDSSAGEGEQASSEPIKGKGKRSRSSGRLLAGTTP